jgi:hypothetical protein
MTAHTKNPAAVALGKLRAATMTAEDRERASRAGGLALARKRTKKQRSASARKAAAARWAKRRPQSAGKKAGK